jgi:hypothetical protein
MSTQWFKTVYKKIVAENQDKGLDLILLLCPESFFTLLMAACLGNVQYSGMLGKTVIFFPKNGKLYRFPLEKPKIATLVIDFRFRRKSWRFDAMWFIKSRNDRFEKDELDYAAEAYLRDRQARGKIADSITGMGASGNQDLATEEVEDAANPEQNQRNIPKNRETINKIVSSIV